MMSKKDEIIRLRKDGKTFNEIAAAIGVCPSYACRVANGREVLSTRKRFSDLPEVDIDVQSKNMGPLTIGAIAESKVIAKLMEIGFDVWKPAIANHRADVAVLIDGKFILIQVKAAGYDKKSKRYRSLLATKNKSGQMKKYSSKEIDFFIVKCSSSEEYYVIPVDVGNLTGYVNLYPHRERLIDAGVSYEKYKNRFDLLKNSGAVCGV